MNKNDVIKTISTVLKAEVNENTMKIDVPVWDSLKHIQIIMELEEKFDIEIPIEKVAEIDSVSALLVIINSL